MGIRFTRNLSGAYFTGKTPVSSLTIPLGAADPGGPGTRHVIVSVAVHGALTQAPTLTLTPTFAYGALTAPYSRIGYGSGGFDCLFVFTFENATTPVAGTDVIRISSTTPFSYASILVDEFANVKASGAFVASKDQLGTGANVLLNTSITPNDYPHALLYSVTDCRIDPALQDLASATGRVLTPGQSFTACGGAAGGSFSNNSVHQVNTSYRLVGPGTPATYDGTYAPADAADVWASALLSFHPEPVLHGDAVGVGRARGAMIFLVGRNPGAVGVGSARGAFNRLVGRSPGAVGVGLASGKLTNAYVLLTGAGGLFTRLGHLGGIINALNLSRGTTVPPLVDVLRDSYDSRDVLMDGIYQALSTWQQGGFRSFLTTLQQDAQDTVVTMANDSASLPDDSLATAVTEIVRQMTARGQSVQRPTVSASYTPGAANSGNAVLVLSMLNAKGVRKDYPFRETLTLTCTADAQQGGTPGNETLSVAAAQEDADPLDWLWPAGSGASGSLTLVDEIAGGSLLTDGGFQDWPASGTLSLPDWTPGQVAGQAASAWGTHLLQSATAYKPTHDGTAAYSLQIKGNGAITPQAYQTLPAGTLAPWTQYAVNCWVYLSGAWAAADQFGIALDRVANGAVSADDAGASNLLTLSPAGLTQGVWLNLQGTFRTPRVLTGTEVLRIGAVPSVSIWGATASVLVDSLTFAPTAELYPGGPEVVACAGSVPLVVGDGYRLSVANGYDSGWQLLLERLLGMRELGLQFPSSASPTVPDNLIV